MIVTRGESWLVRLARWVEWRLTRPSVFRFDDWDEFQRALDRWEQRRP